MELEKKKLQSLGIQRRNENRLLNFRKSFFLTFQEIFIKLTKTFSKIFAI